MCNCIIAFLNAHRVLSGVALCLCEDRALLINCLVLRKADSTCRGGVPAFHPRACFSDARSSRSDASVGTILLCGLSKHAIPPYGTKFRCTQSLRMMSLLVISATPTLPHRTLTVPITKLGSSDVLAATASALRKMTIDALARCGRAHPEHGRGRPLRPAWP